MNYYSTRKNSPSVTFKTALFQGLAPDGGLYMPERIPQLTKEEIAGFETLREVAYTVLRKWIPEKDIPEKDLAAIVEHAFTFPIPLAQVGTYAVLELFHGPTMAFKDIAARVLALLFEYYVNKDKKKMTIMVATSGDTGGAIAQAFSGLKRLQVVVLYPLGRVSELQEEQLTRVGKNVLSIAVKGSFDDCQLFVKKAFQDPELREIGLSSANSINIGRLIPQIIYYVWAYVQADKQRLRFFVPSGNMGDVTAGILAKMMGVPIDSFVIATNENDSVVTYYKTGVYKSKKPVQTLSTAMDIGNPSNFERLLDLFHDDYASFCKVVSVVKVTDKETVETVKYVYSNYDYLMDFHTAIGYHAVEKVVQSHVQPIVVSTASPLKFSKEIEKETGIKLTNEYVLKKLKKNKKRVSKTTDDYKTIKRLILKKLT